MDIKCVTNHTFSTINMLLSSYLQFYSLYCLEEETRALYEILLKKYFSFTIIYIIQQGVDVSHNPLTQYAIKIFSYKCSWKNKIDFNRNQIKSFTLIISFVNINL